MSTIDERVVAMKFDNSQFQKGAADTVASLAKLKDSLNLEGAAKGLSGLDVSNAIASIDQLRSKFEGFGAIATGILLGLGSKIADFAVGAARNIGNNLIEGIKTGFSEYETQINAVQTILANTEHKGTTIDQVNAALQELNEYADKTIYNFGAMTQAIGTFTVAGVGLDDATASVKGFSNVAALSGANATSAAQAMRQLALGISSGVIRLQDWISIETAGIAGEQFQQALMTTARVNGVAVDDMIAKHGSFRLSLQENWLTAEIMTTTLAAMTGDLSVEQLKSMGYSEEQATQLFNMAMAANAAATEVKTFTQLIGTLNEAIGSGWAKSWQIILGDFTEAKALFTEISDRLGGMIGASADARNAQFQFWKDGDARGSGRTAAIDALRNAFDAFMSILDPISRAFRDVFPPSLGQTMLDISFALKDFTAGLKLTEAQATGLHDAFKIIFTGLKFLIEIGVTAIRLFFDNFSKGIKIIGGIGAILSPVATFLANLVGNSGQATSKIHDLVGAFIKMRNEAIDPLIEFMHRLGAALNVFLNGDPSKFSEAWKHAIEPLMDLVDRYKEKWATASAFIGKVAGPVGEAIAAGWEKVMGIVQKVWNFIKPVAAVVGQFFVAVGEGIGKMFAGADLDTVMNGLSMALVVAIAVGIAKVVKKIVGMFTGLNDIKTAFINILDGVTGVLSAMQTNLKAGALLKIAGAIAILALSVGLLSLIEPGRLIGASTALAVLFGVLLGAMAILDKLQSASAGLTTFGDTLKSGLGGVFDSIKTVLKVGSLVAIAAALILLSVAVVILAGAMKTIASMSWEEIAKGLVGIAVAIGLLVGAAAIMEKFQGSILKASFGMLIMAGAIAALAGAVAIFGAMPMDVLIQGGIAIVVTLGLLTVAATVLSKFAPQMIQSAVGLLAMATALNLLVVPLTTLGLLPIEVLTQGMMAVSVMLLVVVIAAQALGQLGPRMLIASVGLMAMASAINMLMVPIALLGAMSIPTLIQGLIGLAAALAIMVIAGNAMSGSLVGAAAMIVMAGAIIIIATALAILGAMPLGSLIGSLIAMAAVFVILGVAGLVLAPLSPVLLLLGAAIALVGVGMVLMAASMMVFSLGLMMLGPALMIVTEGLTAFAAKAGEIAAAVPAFLAIGAGLLVFGAGALVAGVGITALGIGMVLLGAGLAILGAVGLIGAIALGKVIEKMTGMMEHIPGMAIMGAAFLGLSVAIIALGAGMVVLGAGAILVGAGLLLLVPLGALVTMAMNLIIKAIERAVGIAPQMASLGAALSPLGAAIAKVGASGAAAAGGILGVTMSLMALAAAAAVVGIAVAAMAAMVGVSVPLAIVATTAAGVAFQAMVALSLASIRQFEQGITSAIPRIAAAARAMAMSLMSTTASVVAGGYGQMASAGYSVGAAITDGMANGVRAGSYKVSSAARAVALDALASSKAALGVASPSKEYYKIGNWMDEGMADGQTRNMYKVTRASDAVGKGAIAAMRKSLSGLKRAVMSDMDVTPTIRPVLDMSSIKQGASQLNGMLAVPRLRLALDNNYAMANATSAALSDGDDNDNTKQTPRAEAVQNITFIQNLNSPKAISATDAYRGTRNQISRAKEELAIK